MILLVASDEGGERLACVRACGMETAHQLGFIGRRRKRFVRAFLDDPAWDIIHPPSCVLEA
jgi:hypothetical protein